MNGMEVIKYQFVALLIFIAGDVNAAELCENIDITKDDGLQTLKKFIQEQNSGIVSITTTVVDGHSNSKSTFDTTTTTADIPITPTIQEIDPTTFSKSYTKIADEMSTTATQRSQAATNAEIEQSNSETTAFGETTKPTTKAELTTSRPACPLSHFKFATNQHTDYVQYNGIVPVLREFTVCVWLRVEGMGQTESYGVMSYCTLESKRCETLLMLLSNLKISVTIDAESSPYKFDSTFKMGQWVYACIVMSGGVSQYYINGTLHSESVKTINEAIPSGGVLILGNAQGKDGKGSLPGEPVDNSHGFSGEMKEFQLWNKIHSAKEIADLFKSGGCSCNGESTVSFNERNTVIKGNVTASWNIPCR